MKKNYISNIKEQKSEDNKLKEKDKYDKKLKR